MVELTLTQSIPNFVGSGVERFATELLGQKHVASTAAALTADDGQLGIAARKTWKNRGQRRRRQGAADIDERPARTNRRKLPRVADENDPFYALHSVQEGRELVLSKHRAFIDDDGPIAFFARCFRIPEIAAAIPVISLPAL